jgi:N-acetylglucosamine-6-phosphate deacetylase
MRTALVNARILLDAGITVGEAVLVEGERIVGIVKPGEIPRTFARRDLQGALLLPGFIDMQVNGGGGMLFNDVRTLGELSRMSAAHRRFGTTGYLPTLISDDLDVIARAIALIEQALSKRLPGILGIHIEGPFLNPARRGVHDASKFRALDEPAFELLTSLRHGKTVVTLAPETTNEDMIRRLNAAGVVVSAGHTNATYRQIRGALDAGLRGFTHLFNAMSPLTGREPGTVGAALEDIHSWCGLILDGHHVDPVALRLAMRCKPANRFMLVTDAMPTVGMEGDRFMLQGRAITVQDGMCVDAHGTLAGSNLNMAAAVRNATRLLDISLAQAVRMASEYPATFLGLEREMGTIAVGCRANFAIADDALNVLDTWIDGRPVQSSTELLLQLV